MLPAIADVARQLSSSIIRNVRMVDSHPFSATYGSRQ
jgi:hypothetical protein